VSDKEPSHALPAHFYRDPAEVYERLEAATCTGCAHSARVLGSDICIKGRKYGRRCKLYVER
jgi:hypothetical protein